MFASIVLAGPPFVTDDPEVPPVGGWEINIPFTLQRTALGDILLGIKWRFFEDKHSLVQLGTYPQVFAPTGECRTC
jgi:hypothetical protein